MRVSAFYFWLSVLPVLVGFGLVIWSYLSPSRNRHEFRLLRMLALLCGCLLSVSPLWLLSWSLLEATPRGSACRFFAGTLLGTYFPLISLRLFVWLGWIPAPVDRAA